MAFTVALFWLVPSRYRQYALTGLTAAFLLCTAPVSLALLLAMAGITFLVCGRGRPEALHTMLAIVLIVATLVYFKLGVRIDQQFGTGMLVPLGLSYYALRVIHLILERFMGRIEELGITDIARYLLFLPTIQIGPIHRYGQFKRDLQRHRWTATDIWGGIERIVFGYAKITFLGNYIVSGVFANYIVGFEQTNPALYEYLDCIRYGANLYFQFSGYSDIAIGFAMLLGFHVMENFDNPYFKRNISEFWRAWHISLTSWCREYIYTSVTAVARRPAFGAIASLVVIGLWHEISMRYLAWGLYHGLGIVGWQLFQNWKPDSWRAKGKWTRCCAIGLSILLTLNFVIIGFAITKEPTLAGGFAILLKIATFGKVV
jgi:alginate O-acetyltransferase complex protein AlgI